MILILFGRSGAGKNHIGELLQKEFGFYFYDADELLPEEAKELLINKKHFTEEIRNQITKNLIQKTNMLKEMHPKLVIAQALYKEKNRKEFLLEVPLARLIYVFASLSTTITRIKNRNNSITPEYAIQMDVGFEEPIHPQYTIYNNASSSHLIEQLSDLLQAIKLKENNF